MIRRRSAIFILALLALPLLSSCVKVLNPVGWTAVAFDGDTAFFTTSKGRLSAVDVNGDAGTAKWTFPDPDNSADKKIQTKAIYGAPIIEGDRVYLSTFHGGIFALDKATGRPIWADPENAHQGIDGDIISGVASAGDVLFFGTTEGRLYARNKSDGLAAPGWASPRSFGGGIWATPVVEGDTVYIATMEGEVHAVSVQDGSERWTKPFSSSGAIADLQLVQGLLFAPSVNRTAYFLRPEDGSLAGQYKADDWLWTNSASDDGRAFFGDFGGNVHAIDITSFTEAWKANVEDERIRSGPAIVGDVLVVADRKPVVSFINLADGKILNTVPILGAGSVRSDLTVKDGHVYIATTSGKLFRAEPETRRVVEVQLSGVKK